MNEKINGLWSQAQMGYNDQRCDPEVVEKFAKMIVRECVMICKSHKIQSTDDVWYLAHNETVNNISENIEEYFGVEE